MEVGELKRLGSDGGVGLRELGSDAADRGLEGRYGGSDSGKGVLGGLERGKLREEVMVAGKDLGSQLGLEEADGVVQLLSGGGRGA